jgi:hypothetical protein
MYTKKYILYLLYLETQDDTTLCNKMLLKKLQSQIKKKSFQTKKQQRVTDFFAYK